MLLPEQWIDSPHIGEYPVIHTGTLTVSDAKEVVVEESGDEESEDTPASDVEPFTKEQCYELMRQAAADEFAKGCDMPDLTLDIDFIHIGDTEEYRQYRNLERVFLYDLVRIRHAPTGFVAKAQVSGYEWDALTKRYKSITVGNVFAVESSAVAGYQLSEGAVTATKIAPGSVSGSSLRELSVTNGKIAHAAIGTANIQDVAITRAQIADAAVGTAQIGQAAITQALIGAEAVGTTQIADGSITDAKIVELTANKINAGTLSVERLELVGSHNSVVYALNNSGGLVSQNVDSLDGDVLTERSITGDMIVLIDALRKEMTDMPKFMTWAIIRALTLKGKRSLRDFLTNCSRANDLSRELLMQIVRDNKDTEYGKRYHFDQIHSIEDYKRLVPFSGYDDYAPYIERMVEKGEKNLITAYPIVQYAETSGSVGVPKKIPVSRQSMNIYTKYTITRVTALADAWHREHTGKPLPIGRGFNQLEIVDRTLPDGTPLGNISGSAAKSYKWLFPYYLTSPLPVLYPKGYMPMMYLKVRFCLADRDTTFLFSVFMTNLVDMMNYIRRNWEMLVEDIRTGAFNDEVKIDEETKAELMKVTRPDPKRAAELEAEFRKGFDTPIIPRI